MSTQQYRTAVLLAAALLAGCGGGSGTPQSTCSLGSSAGCGGTLSPVIPTVPPSTPVTPAPPVVAPAAATISLVFSSNELGSAGLPGKEVAVTAVVRTADNAALADAPVAFSADSGVLSGVSGKTDSFGRAFAVLATGNSKANRPIKVSVQADKIVSSGIVNVVGTTVRVSGPASMLQGSKADLVLTLTDSADRPIPNENIVLTSKIGNALVLAAKVSDAAGQLTVRLEAAKAGSELLTAAALGASGSKDIEVAFNDLSLSPALRMDAAGNELPTDVALGSCTPVDGRYTGTAGTTVALAATRGRLFADAACSVPLAGARALLNGAFPHSWLKADTAGASTIEASITGGPKTTTRIDIVAPLTPLATLNLQTDVAVVGAGEKSTLVATVRDGLPANNLVKGAAVQFAILADPSGGNLLSPFSGITGSDGVVRAVYVAGPGDGLKDATVLQAQLGSMPAVLASTSITVNKKALSIQFGTGNRLIEFSPEVLQQDFAIFVTDSSGKAVPNVQVRASAWPTSYRKGWYDWLRDDINQHDAEPGLWTPTVVDTCANEDQLRRGSYASALDTNGNGVLDPGIPLSVSSSGVTDGGGLATLSLRYPRDRANWVRVELSVIGTVAGTETVARSALWLSALASDLNKFHTSPPGAQSPYGQLSCCSAL